MSTKRAIRYLIKKKGKTTPMQKKEEVAQHPDNKIDQDFPGFPHGQSSEKIIHPVTRTEKKTAGVYPEQQKH
ncbi:hypothetical protein [Ferruginibacter sp.]